MRVQAGGVAAVLVAAAASAARAEVFFKETFSDEAWRERWVDSTLKGEQQGKWEWSPGEWHTDAETDKGIQTSEAARFYGISAKLPEPFSNRGKDLVLQYSSKEEKRGSSHCGGSYIKLMGSDLDQDQFGGDTPYKIMFGPDQCGMESRIHMILNYKAENQLRDTDIKLDYADKNEFTHLYTLHLRPDNTYTVYVDMEERASGDLGSDFKVIPSKEIDDPEDKKPEDWVDEEMMLDPEDVKPEGYDDIPETIPDPEAAKPDDWSDEDDGEWEPPMIPNPDYKGPWVQKKIKNPDYKGPWKPRQIPNPDYDPEAYAFDDIGSVGFELWQVNHGSIFDNIFVGDSLEEAFAFAKETFSKTKDGEKAAKEAFDKAAKEAEEAKKADEEEEDEAEEEADDLDEKEEL